MCCLPGVQQEEAGDPTGGRQIGGYGRSAFIIETHGSKLVKAIVKMALAIFFYF